MKLQCKEAGSLHPEGIHAAVCVDVIDMGLQEVEFQGQRKMVPKVRLVFETEAKSEEGRPLTLSKTLTASIHPKARLAEILGKWRGRALVTGETIDLDKLIGVSCTLLVSHQQNTVGRTFASIDAVSKATKKLTPSGGYDPALARQRIAEWANSAATSVAAHGRPGGPPAAQPKRQAEPAPQQGPPPAGPSRTSHDYDPEIGF